MLRTLGKRERQILYLTACVVIAAVAFNFLISPLIARNNQLNQRINLSREKIKKYLSVLKQKSRIQSQYTTLGLSKAGQGQDTDVGVLSELETLAKGDNIRILEIRPQASQNLNLYKETVIVVRTEASIDNYLKFIYDLENSLLLLKIRQFQLTARPPNPLLEGNLLISQLSLN
jgi:hypothetical protein